MVDGKKIFGAFTVALALFFFWPVVVGNWQTVSALRAAVAEREDLLAQRERILAQISTAYTEYTTKLSSQDGQKFAALVPVKKDQAELLSAVQDIATTSGVTLSELRILDDSAKATGQFKTLSMSMELGGTYQSLRAFLGGVEQYVRLLNIDSMQVAQDANAPGKLKFTIKASAYFLK